jgi:murein DD-endopeptidase MepM/ murein hydrolase activator NlpD
MAWRVWNSLFLWLALISPQALAADFALDLPVACTYGKDCWITKHVDHDLGPGVRDFACGRLADDTHNGVDFALRDEVEMMKGVEVLAAADGTVNRVRDGMPDTNVRLSGKDPILKMECGNGLLIDHPGGWQTQYCHMRMGSLAVSSGMKVKAGQVLGLIGMSGMAELPHLHFMVRHEGKIIDPFSGRAMGQADDTSCGNVAGSVWKPEALEKLPYRPVVALNAGFTPGDITVPESRSGKWRQAPFFRDSARLRLFADIIGSGAGDQLTMKILGPDGSLIFNQVSRIEKPSLQRFEVRGPSLVKGRWRPGRYQGVVSVQRQDQVFSVEAETQIIE